MRQLYPYLALGGNCEAALEFYCGVFDGRVKTLMRLGDSIPDVPEEKKQDIIHAELESPGVSFMLSDGMLDAPLPAGGPIAMAVGLDDTADQDRIWARLAEGGTVKRALHDTFYGGRMGVLTDKFGIDWMLNYLPPSE